MAGVAVGLLALSGCMAQASLTTPTQPLTYRWAMVFDVVGKQTWVQVGPKVDGSGAHVCVQAWDHGQVFWGCFDSLVPGSTHDYGVVPTVNGYAETFDGRVLVTIPLTIPNATPEIGEELTSR